MAPCLREVQIDTGTLLLSQCLFLLLVFLAWFCLQFPSQGLIYFGDFKTKSTSHSASSGHKDLKGKRKKEVFVFTHNSSLNSAGLTQKAFYTEFALQGACGAGVSRCSYLKHAHQKLQQSFSTYLVNPAKFLLSLPEVSKGASLGSWAWRWAAGWGLALWAGQASVSNSSVALCIKTLGGGKGASSVSRGTHHRGRLLNWHVQAGGGFLSPPLLWHRETPSLGGRCRGLRHWALKGVHNFSDCSGCWHPCLGDAPPSTCSYLLYALIFLQLLLKITGNLSCNLAGTLVDCLQLCLPLDTDVLGRVLPCASDFLLYM